MAKLNQVLAIEPSVRSRADEELTRAYRNLQKANLLTGITRTYQPNDEEGEFLPPESVKVQLTVADAINQVSQHLVALFDTTATKDIANTHAKASVVVDGYEVLTNVPVTYLLWLEKQLVNLHTFVGKLPTLDPAQQWTFDNALGVFRSEPQTTTRSRKVRRNHVLAEATDKHPAQVEVYTEDQQIGKWTRVDYSGAIPQTQASAFLSRVEKLQQAVKTAREEANMAQVDAYSAGNAILGYVFGNGGSTPS